MSSVTSTYRLSSPFAPGDRIREKSNPEVTAVVSALTPDGFAYLLDHPQGVPRLGLSWIEGECFASGFSLWERLPETRGEASRPRKPIPAVRSPGSVTATGRTYTYTFTVDRERPTSACLPKTR